MSILKQYKFYLTKPDKSVIELTPINNDLLFSTKREKDQVYFRRTLDTELRFKHDDFTAIKAIEEGALRNTRMGFLIKHLDGGVATDFFSAYLCLDNCRFDNTKCVIDATLDNDDGYTCIFDNWEEEFNIFTILSRQTIQTFFGTYETDICTILSDPSNTRLPISDFYGCINEGEAWNFYRYDILDTANPALFRHIVTFIRLTATMPCAAGVPVAPPGDGWILIDDNCPTDATYVKEVETSIDPTQSNDVETVYTYSTESIADIDNGIFLNDILEDFLVCPYMVVSNFFGINPDATSPTNDAYDAALEKLQNVVVFQKSDIKRAAATQNATKGLWSYKELLDVLRQQFQVYFVVIPSLNILRIEHISYFKGTATDTFDLTTYNSTNGFNAYEYDTGELVKYDVLEYGEEVSDDFAGSAISYPDSCASKDENTRSETISLVNNDVTFIIDNTDLISDKGFVFVPTIEISGSLYMFDEYNAESGTLELNGHMSIPNLFDKYWRHDRPFINGVMNGSDVIFESAKKIKVQPTLTATTFTADEWTNLDETDYMKTEVSDEGELIDATWSAKNRSLTVNTMH